MGRTSSFVKAIPPTDPGGQHFLEVAQGEVAEHQQLSTQVQ